MLESPLVSSPSAPGVAVHLGAIASDLGESVTVSSERAHEMGVCFVRENPDCSDCPMCGATFPLDPMPRALRSWQRHQLFWWTLCVAAISFAVVSAVAG